MATRSFLASEVVRIWRLVVARWAVYLLMVTGLALAYCASIVIGLYVRDELTYDQSIPNAERIYLITPKYGPPGQPLIDSDRSPAGVARWMRTDLAEVEQVTRIEKQDMVMSSQRYRTKEKIYWADPNFFRVIKLTALHGDPVAALHRPDGVVMSRKLAMAYFGSDDVVGRLLLMDGQFPLRVSAVLADFPPNIHLDRELFVSGINPHAKFFVYDQHPEWLWPNSYTYATFRQGVDIHGMPSKLQALSRIHWQGPNNPPDAFSMVAIKHLHFQRHGDGELKPRGHLDFVIGLTGIAATILTLACINFSSLILAERDDRIDEMTLYSALGARRIDLMGVVFREAAVVNLVSAWLGLVGAEQALSWLNVTLDLRLSLWSQPFAVLLTLFAFVVLMSVSGGVVPAVVVSSTKRAKEAAWRMSAAKSMRWRGWVVAQLALVIVLLTASHTLSRQWTFATHDALGFDTRDVLMIKYPEGVEFTQAFAKDVRKVPGVTVAAESWGAPTNDFVRAAWVNPPGHPMVALTRNSVHPDFLNVYEVPLLAGRNLSGTFVSPEEPREILLNATAVEALGFGHPENAIGKVIEYGTDRTRMRSTVVGVLRDVRIGTVYEAVQPMIFDNFSKYFTQVNIRIAPEDIGPTLRRIDALWNKDSAGAVPIEMTFFNDYLGAQYRYLHQQMLVCYIVSAASIILSVLGLTGLSIFLARSQTRELAIRKALGATFSDLFAYRFRPFLVPILLTNAVGWPMAWICLKAWLQSFADHVALSAESFLAAGFLTVVASFITIATHCAITAHEVSVSSSLRHR